jgi:single-strand DNA-binding protein
MSYNRQELIGYLGGNPEGRYTKSGRAVTNFSMATNEQWTDKEGVKHEQTEWHNVVTFGKLADICREYLKSGRQVFVAGRTQHRKWEDRNGNSRSTTEVVANTVKFLGKKEEAQSAASAPRDDSQPPAIDHTPPVSDDDVPS